MPPSWNKGDLLLREGEWFREGEERKRKGREIGKGRGRGGEESQHSHGRIS